MEIEQIFELAKVFRNAIVSVPRSEFSTSLGYSDFPYGCCDDASQLLAAFLSDNGYKESKKVTGIHRENNGELKSHVWLSYSGLIIDITADQFPNYNNSSVIVVLESSFHESFENEIEESADFRMQFENDLVWLSKFNSDYEKVLRKINA
jgi:hypothetical protein